MEVASRETRTTVVKMVQWTCWCPGYWDGTALTLGGTASAITDSAAVILFGSLWAKPATPTCGCPGIRRILALVPLSGPWTYPEEIFAPR